MTSREPAHEKRPLQGRRALQAEQTRRDILTAARHRFARQGYAATNLKDIAADAGVSVQTVYDSVGTKPDLVRRLNDLIDEEAQVGEIAATLASLDDPLAIARVPARITCRLIDRCGDILRARASQARRQNPDSPDSPRKEGAGTGPAPLPSPDSSRTSAPSEPRSTSIRPRPRSLLSPTSAFAILLIDDHHLTLDQLEDWIADTTIRAVFEP